MVKNLLGDTVLDLDLKPKDQQKKSLIFNFAFSLHLRAMSGMSGMFPSHCATSLRILLFTVLFDLEP
jgi:hypothetical protein